MGLANQNAQISEISFYEVNLEIILPLIYLPRLRTYVLCPLRLLFLLMSVTHPTGKTFTETKGVMKRIDFFCPCLAIFCLIEALCA